MKKAILASAVLAAVLAVPAIAGGYDSYIGEVFAIPPTGYLRYQCPQGSHLADGTEFKIAEYQALFVVIGEEYGGERGKTFKLPDLRDAGLEPKTGPKLMWCINMTGIFPVKH